MRLRAALVLAAFTGLVGCQDHSPDPTGASPRSAAAAQEDLITLVAAPGLTNAQEALLSRIRAEPSAGEVHIGRLAPTPAPMLQRGRAVRISVSPTRHVVAVGDAVSHDEPGVVSWTGSVQGDREGQVQLVFTSNGVTASVWAGRTLYRIEPIGDGLHAIVRVELSALPAPTEPDHPVGRSGPAPTALRGSGFPGGMASLATASTSTRIDVMVVYTAAAASAAGNIGDRIRLAVNESNTSYTNSAVGVSVRNVYSAQVSYSEANRTYEQHVNALQGTTDGMMDVVHGWRNTYGADVVILVVNDTDFCGWAYQIMATESTAFAVVHVGCLTGNYTFAHEIGHLQGARHDPFVDPTNTPFAYGHGYVDPNRRWRTVMAYGNACGGCQPVQYWSNPNVTYPPTGQAMGTAATHDNARVLNETRGTIAGFRIAPPSVYISGKQYIARYESAQYVANASDGTPPYTYQWRSRDRSPSWGWGAWQSWSSPSSLNYTYASVNSCGIDSKELQVMVTDSGGRTGTSTYQIFITNPC